MKNMGRVSNVFSLPHKTLGARRFRVWTPPNYQKENTYPLIFAFDGEMLFSDEQTWNGLTWELDKVAEKWILQGELSPCIIVAVYSGGPRQRFQELLPENVFNKFTKAQKNALYQAYYEGGLVIPEAVCSNALNTFIAQDLLPFLRREYVSSYSESPTYIMGSSMGGLAALNALCEFPDIFTGAGCLSTHWPVVLPTSDMDEFQKPPVSDQMLAYFCAKLAKIAHKKLYFDYGDQELDAAYPELQKRMDQALINMEYPQQLWVSKHFPGDGHSERAWSARVHEALQFLINDQ